MKTITLNRRCEKHSIKRMLLHPAILKRRLINNMKAWLLVLPAFIFLLLFTLYPIFSTFGSSLYLKNLSTRIPRFVGIENYQGLIGDQVFFQAVKNNLIVAFVTIPLSIFLALLMAMFANSRIRGRGIIRAGFFYPTLLPMIAVANIWLFFYTPGYGLISLAGEMLGLGKVNLLGNPKTVLPAVMAVLVWKEAGYFMIFFLSGLQNIPREMYEASHVDGSSNWQTFKNITWPLLMPTTLFVIIIAFTNSFKNVDHLYIMTKGGPDNASTMILYYIYQVGFEFWDTGRASAITTVLIAILLFITCIKFFIIDRRTYYS